jgi:FtsH-binding integral membrane protein
MFESLFAKTFFIIAVQLILTFIGAFASVKYMAGQLNSGAINLNSKNEFKKYFWGAIIADILLYLALFMWSIFGGTNLWIGGLLVSLWSIANGVIISFSLISIDINLGLKAIGATVLIVILSALVGIYSKIDFSFLGKFLFIGLLIFIGIAIIGIFTKMSSAKQRFLSLFGAVLFTGFLLFDFNNLSKMSEAAINSWNAAMLMSINIYLDIINLLLNMLNLLGNN